MYTEACNLSAKLRNAPRPQKPLKIIIAGAGITSPNDVEPNEGCLDLE